MLELLHRQHAQVEDRVKALTGSDTSHLPFSPFNANAAWLEPALASHDVLIWTQQPALDGEHRLSEPSLSHPARR